MEIKSQHTVILKWSLYCCKKYHKHKENDLKNIEKHYLSVLFTAIRDYTDNEGIAYQRSWQKDNWSHKAIQNIYWNENALIVSVVEIKKKKSQVLSYFWLPLYCWISKHAACPPSDSTSSWPFLYISAENTSWTFSCCVSSHFQHAPAKSPISHMHSILHVFLLPSDVSEDSMLSPKHA